MITERTLRQWRRDALTCLHTKQIPPPHTAAPGEQLSINVLRDHELCNRILRLTQELQDINLMRRSK